MIFRFFVVTVRAFIFVLKMFFWVFLPKDQEKLGMPVNQDWALRSLDLPNRSTYLLDGDPTLPISEPSSKSTKLRGWFFFALILTLILFLTCGGGKMLFEQLQRLLA